MPPVRPRIPAQLPFSGGAARVKQLPNGSVLLASGKTEVLAVPSGPTLDFFEPNGERYQRGDLVAQGRGWRPLEIGTQTQFALSRALLRAWDTSRDSRATGRGSGNP